jgi:hypothetical protein
MSIGDDLRKKFWDWMGEMTTSRPMTSQQTADYNAEKELARTKKYLENLDTIVSISEDIEQWGSGDLKASKIVIAIRKGTAVLKKYKFAAELGYEAAAAAEEVHVALQEMSAQAHARCKDTFSADEDEVTQCLVKYDRQWQARNVKAVLDINDPDSWIRKVWVRWGSKILDLLI